MAYEYYEYLRIERSASTEEIKKAYRKRAMESHPDRHKGDKEKEKEFKQVNEAYSVLSDPEKRSHYDRFGSLEGMGGFSWFSGFEGMGGFSGFEDIFENFFSGGQSRSTRRKQKQVWADIEVRMRLSLEDAILGTTRTIEYMKHVLCKTCAWKGAEKDSDITECSTCHGTGQIRHRTNTIFGIMEQSGLCDTCQGSGKVIAHACSTCHGTGTLEEKVKKDVVVPQWIESGMSIKSRGEGHSGKDGDGDLYITFEVPDREANLIREGMNVHTTIKVTPAEAVLWVEKEIPLPIFGKKSIKIHHGTSHGTIITHRWEGIQHVSNTALRWDILFHIEIEIPKRLSHDERKLYEALFELEWWKKWEKGFLGRIFE